MSVRPDEARDGRRVGYGEIGSNVKKPSSGVEQDDQACANLNEDTYRRAYRALEHPVQKELG